MLGYELHELIREWWFSYQSLEIFLSLGWLFLVLDQVDSRLHSLNILDDLLRLRPEVWIDLEHLS